MSRDTGLKFSQAHAYACLSYGISHHSQNGVSCNKTWFLPIYLKSIGARKDHTNSSCGKSECRNNIGYSSKPQVAVLPIMSPSELLFASSIDYIKIQRCCVRPLQKY